MEDNFSEYTQFQAISTYYKSTDQIIVSAPQGADTRIVVDSMIFSHFKNTPTSYFLYTLKSNSTAIWRGCDNKQSTSGIPNAMYRYGLGLRCEPNQALLLDVTGSGTITSNQIARYTIQFHFAGGYHTSGGKFGPEAAPVSVLYTSIPSDMLYITMSRPMPEILGGAVDPSGHFSGRYANRSFTANSGELEVVNTVDGRGVITSTIIVGITLGGADVGVSNVSWDGASIGLLDDMGRIPPAFSSISIP